MIGCGIGGKAKGGKGNDWHRNAVSHLDSLFVSSPGDTATDFQSTDMTSESPIRHMIVALWTFSTGKLQVFER